MLANSPSSYAASHGHNDQDTPRPLRVATERYSASRRNGSVILFGEFRLVPSTRSLTRKDSPAHLGTRAFDILTALIDRAGQVVLRSSSRSFGRILPSKKAVLRVHIVVGARNDKVHCTVTQSRWIIASSRVEPQNKKRTHFGHMRGFSQGGAVG
jgi:hypothetical protein